MGCKTVLKSILKYAPKSIEMVNALRFDQAAVNVNSDNADELNIDYFTPEYVDNEPAIQDATAEEVDPSADLFNSEKKGK